MPHAKRILILLGVAAIVGTASFTRVTLNAASIKLADPTTVVMIVNRDSNDIAFMDMATKKIVGRAFLGNNVNPHTVSYTHLRAHETPEHLVCRLLLEKKKKI